MTISDRRPIASYVMGDTLYRYIFCGGVFAYTAVGRREYEGSVQLEVECQTCSHGWKCRLLLAQDDYGRVVAVHMLNDDEHDSQRHWHANEGLHFWPTKREARDEQLKRLIATADENIRKCEDSLAAAKKRRAELTDLIEKDA